MLASAAYDLSKAGLQDGAKWVERKLAGLHDLAQSDCHAPSGYWRYVDTAQGRRTAIFVGLPREGCAAPSLPDPSSDRLGIFFDYNRDPILLDTWAWQTLLLFQHEFLGKTTGQDRAIRQQLLAFAMMPARKHAPAKTFNSPLELVASTSYRTPHGYVDIGRAKTKKGFQGLVEISGVPGRDGTGNFLGSYPLPRSGSS